MNDEINADRIEWAQSIIRMRWEYRNQPAYRPTAETVLDALVILKLHELNQNEPTGSPPPG